MIGSWDVVLVDDHALVRRGLASLLAADGRFHVVAEASDGLEAVEVLGRVAAHLVILDLSMPRSNGLEALERIREGDPARRILMLSMYTDEQFVMQAMASGANGYLLKHAMDDELFRAIETVLAGREYVSTALKWERRSHDRPSALVLTPREREVVRLIASGRRTAEVAHALGISPHTAVRHVANVMRKLGVHTRVELVRRAADLAVVVPG